MTATTALTEPPRATPRVRIRPAGTADLTLAYRLATGDPLAWPRLYLSGPIQPGTFAERLWRDVTALWVIEGAEGPAGLVGLHGTDHRHGTTWLEAVAVPGFDDLADHGVALACAHAFAVVGLHKVVSVAVGPRAGPLAALGGLAEREATLPESVWAEGLHWGQDLWALHREAWEQGGPALLSRLGAT